MRERFWIGLGALALASAIGAAALAQALPAPGANGASAPAGNPDHGHQLSVTCTACHGPTGDSANPAYPKLAGQDPAYLVAQMQAYKSGARTSPVMTSLLTLMSDSDLADVAAWYASQSPTPDPGVDPALAAKGGQIFRTAGGGIPACAACHGPQGAGGGGMGMMGHGPMAGHGPMMHGGAMGMMANMGPVPHLAAQHAAYAAAQLDAFASGARSSPVMSRIAGALSAADRQAVAAYLASLP